MQAIKRSKLLQIPLLNELEELYMFTSEKTLTDAKIGLFERVFDSSLKSIQDLFNEYSGTSYDFRFTPKKYSLLDLPKFDDKNIIVCFSGGKDSAALALKLRDDGYNVFLYHLRGINKTYWNEWKVAEQFAKKFDFPIFIDKVVLSGVHDWVEHPMKNMIIANGALSYGIENNIGTAIAFGNFKTSSLDNDPFEVCGGDCEEVWQVYENSIETIIPEFKITLVSDSFQDTVEYIEKNPDVLNYTISCMTQSRYREQLRRKNQKKYGFPKLENRCGSCWKCCLEYCTFANAGIFEYNEKYYNHCLDILQKTLYKEAGILYNIDKVKEHYLL